MLKTFRIGGVHPPENKLTAGKAIQTLELPKQVSIMLSQHIGAPAQCVVNKGDHVKVGTLLAQANGFVSANIHSPVSGTVAKIENVTDSNGYTKAAVIIDVEGDEWEESIDRSEKLVKGCPLTAKEIVDIIGEKGIVGLGGATFPSKVKLCPPPGNKAEILIINAVECEPYLTNDHALMLAKPEQIVEGVAILMKAINVSKAVIGIENNKPDAIATLSRVASGYLGIEVQPLKVRYPQGGEKQLIDAIIRRQVASGALPISTGAVVQNVATAYAVYEAVQKNKPLVERVMTVTGKSLKNPGNFLVRLGTPVANLIEAAGGLPEDSGKVILGGPMMGRAAVSLSSPVGKGTSGVLIIPESEATRKKEESCIRCAKCVSACPMGLEPYLLAKVSSLNMLDRAEKENIMDCIECGCCTFTCPANRPLLDYVRIGKSQVGAIIRSRAKK